MTAWTRPSLSRAIATLWEIPTHHEDHQHDQRWQDADGEEVLRPDQQRDDDTDAHEGEIEEEADPASDADVEGGHGQGERDAEGHHLAARFVTLLPEGASPAHTPTVGPLRGPWLEPRRRALSAPRAVTVHNRRGQSP